VPASEPSGGVDELGALIGLEHLESGDEYAKARVPVAEGIRQIHGIVHGGVYAVIAESVCSRATSEAVKGDGMIATGQANQATFLRPISQGHVNADARVRHRGRTTWVWDCELSDDEGRLCALVRMTVAVRPRPS
jgi:1,4-dihydroxy-2-naphthoyl-CoA hydrolase